MKKNLPVHRTKIQTSDIQKDNIIFLLHQSLSLTKIHFKIFEILNLSHGHNLSMNKRPYKIKNIKSLYMIMKHIIKIILQKEHRLMLI